LTNTSAGYIRSWNGSEILVSSKIRASVFELGGEKKARSESVCVGFIGSVGCGNLESTQEKGNDIFGGKHG